MGDDLDWFAALPEAARAVLWADPGLIENSRAMQVYRRAQQTAPSH